MNRRFWVVGVALAAVGCTTTLEPIGNLGGTGGAGSGAGEGGAAGTGIGPDAGGGIGGGAAVGGYAGMAGIGGIGGIGGYPGSGGSAGYAGAAGSSGEFCDDGDPCTADFGQVDEFGSRCCHVYFPECGMGGGGVSGELMPGCEGGAGGSAGEAGIGGIGGSAGYGGGMPLDAGIAGVGGYAGSAGVGGAAGGIGCDDGDPCTIDSPFPDEGGCLHQYDPYCGMGGSGGYGGAGSGGYGGYAGEAGIGGSGGCGEMGPDLDGDGYQNTTCNADCDDTDPNAFPYQWSYFVEPRNSGGYDYDCDGQVTLRFGQLYAGCTLDAMSQGCVGSGWTSEDAPTAFLPGCGQTSTYAFCEFTGAGCAVSMHAVTQACR